MGGGASTTSTVFGLSEPQQGLGSQWSMEAKQSPRPRAASTERKLGWRPLWYAVGSEQRINQKGNNVDNLRPELHRSWRKKEHCHKRNENSKIGEIENKNIFSYQCRNVNHYLGKLLGRAHHCKNE